MITMRMSIGALCVALCAVGLPLPVPAVALEEEIHVFRTMEDPDVQPNLAVCEAASFGVNVVLGASLWAIRTRSKNSLMVNLDSRRIGSGPHASASPPSRSMRRRRSLENSSSARAPCGRPGAAWSRATTSRCPVSYSPTARCGSMPPRGSSAEASRATPHSTRSCSLASIPARFGRCACSSTSTAAQRS